MDWSSDKTFFLVFLPLSALSMFVLGPLATFVSLENFYAPDIIPYDLTGQLLSSLQAATGLSNPLVYEPTRKSAFKLKGHVHDIPLMSMDTHFDMIKNPNQPTAQISVVGSDNAPLMEHLLAAGKGDRKVGFVHNYPITVGSRGVVLTVKKVKRFSDNSYQITVVEGGPFETESIRNDIARKFLVGDVELIAKDKKMYHFGQVVQHKSFGYRGVVIGSDRHCQKSENWIREMKVDSLVSGRNQPFYKVLVDNNDRPGNQETYVAHENIIVSRGQITHNRLGMFFRSYDDEKYVYIEL